MRPDPRKEHSDSVRVGQVSCPLRGRGAWPLPTCAVGLHGAAVAVFVAWLSCVLLPV